MLSKCEFLPAFPTTPSRTPSSAQTVSPTPSVTATPSITMSPPPAWKYVTVPRSWASIASSSDGNRLVAVEGWGYASFGAGGGQIYTSSNSGAVWIPRDSIRKWTAVASSTNGSKLVAAAQNGYVYTSSDFGTTWVPRESIRLWTSVASSSDGSRLVASVQDGYVYTSSDFGATWIARDSIRKWAALASSSNGSNLVASILINSTAISLLTSSNFGVTWNAALAIDGGSSFYRAPVFSSADGSLIALLAVDYLATSGLIYISSNKGSSWQLVPPPSSYLWIGLNFLSNGTLVACASCTSCTGYGSQLFSSSAGAPFLPRSPLLPEINVNSAAIATSLNGSFFAVAFLDGGLYSW